MGATYSLGRKLCKWLVHSTHNRSAGMMCLICVCLLFFWKWLLACVRERDDQMKNCFNWSWRWRHIDAVLPGKKITLQGYRRTNISSLTSKAKWACVYIHDACIIAYCIGFFPKKLLWLDKKILAGFDAVGMTKLCFLTVEDTCQYCLFYCGDQTKLGQSLC